ncbi:hypothetical protein [Nonomuraea angiospora]|uniref:hypothetical protein n=1 Tax=Nonomuraea angiospora TaxID=46172 RepID=UPI0038D4F615
MLGYVSLGEVPSTYPGGDQVAALAEFECKVLQVRQKLPLDEYETDTVVPREEDWNTGDGEYENYAPCLVSRKDGKPIPSGRRVADPPPGADNEAVRMDVLSPALYDNPPADSCIQSQSQWDKSPHSVDIVKCDHPHWAQIAAYVKLYGAADKIPADDKVEEKAEEMCDPATAHLEIGVGTPYRVTARVRKERAIQESLIYAVCLVHRKGLVGRPGTAVGAVVTADPPAVPAIGPHHALGQVHAARMAAARGGRHREVGQAQNERTACCLHSDRGAHLRD